MTPARSGPPDSVPTLTEVIEWPRAERSPKGEAPVEEPPLGPTPEPVRDPADPLPEQDPPADVPPAREPPAVPDGEPAPPPVRAAAEPAVGSLVSSSPASPFDERQLKESILVDLQRQIDAVIEYRMREVLTPILTRATDSIVRDARAELSRSLRTWIDQSVAQELRRQRGQ